MNSKVVLALAAVALPISVLPIVAGAAEAVRLEEVIVTAQKRPQGLREVPISVATIAEDQLNTIFSGGDDILALANRAPGLYAESSNGRGAPRFYIRGLGNVDFDLASSQPVSVIMDDVVMENVTFKSFPLFDLDRVEVIRGPQGTLFGRNTTAGIVKFDTKRPDFFNDAYVSVSGGELGTLRLEGAVGGGLSDTFAVRASVLSNKRDDWVDNGFTGERDAIGGYDETAVRLQGLWKATDDATWLFTYQTRDLDGSASIFRANVFTTGQEGLNQNYDRDQVLYDKGDGNPQDIEIQSGTVKFTLERPEVTMTSITSYQTSDYSSKGDIDGGVADTGAGMSAPGFIPFDAVTEDQAEVSQFTQEVRFSGEGEGFSWQTGVYAFVSDLDVVTIDGFFGATSVNHRNTSWAVFGQVDYPITEQLTFTGGVRYTNDEKHLRVGDQNVGGFALVINVASIQQYRPVDVSDNQVSWEASLNYEIDSDSSVYTRLANGFRAQSIQARDVAFEGLPSVAEPETISSFEVGYKADLFDARARVNVAAYYYQVDDLQLSAIGGANNGNSLLNADKGTGMGLELDAEWLVTDQLLLTGGFGLADTEIQDSGLETAICGSGACTPKDPIRVDPARGTLANIDGNPFQAAPRHTANLGLRYSIPVDSGELYFFSDWAWQGETQMALYDAVEFNTDNQKEIGVRLAYRNDAAGYEIAAFGRNITDEDNIKGFIDFNNNTGFVNEPRIWGVDFRYEFF